MIPVQYKSQLSQVVPLARQSDVKISVDGSAIDASFRIGYGSIDAYNVSYVRGYLTLAPFTSVDVNVVKSTTKLRLTPVDAGGKSVTIEWAVESKTSTLF